MVPLLKHFDRNKALESSMNSVGEDVHLSCFLEAMSFGSLVN